jgi:hypothetical protein
MVQEPRSERAGCVMPTNFTILCSSVVSKRRDRGAILRCLLVVVTVAVSRRYRNVRIPAYLSKCSNPQVLPQNELPDLNWRLFHGAWDPFVPSRTDLRGFCKQRLRISDPVSVYR